MFRSTFLLLILLNPVGALAQSNTLMVLGDSLSSGHGLGQGQDWVTLLEHRLAASHKNYAVVNASLSGDTTQSALSRLPRALLQHQPSLVIVELGANDGLRGLSIDVMRRNLNQIVALCRQGGAKVLLVGMQLPPNYGPRYTQEFTQSYARVAKEQGVALAPFLLAGIGEDLAYFQPDRIHPNAKAQPVLLENVWKYLLPLL